MRKKINIYQKLNCKIKRYIFGRITYEWCIVGNTIGRHCWALRKEKCINGVPKIAGGFLKVYKCSNKEEGLMDLEEFKKVADEINRNKYGE